jgi:small nuclear ribonucleoprotein (snRNP)-like protein
MWLYYPFKVAVIINIILGAFLLIFIKNGWEIFDKLYVKDDEAVTGQFKDFSAYENMYDLDNKMTKGGSPGGRRARSGSDDEIQRQSIGKLDLNNQAMTVEGN